MTDTVRNYITPAERREMAAKIRDNADILVDLIVQAQFLTPNIAANSPDQLEDLIAAFAQIGA